MRLSNLVRASVVAISALGASTAAFADSGSVRFTVYKAGWFLGGSGGEGTMTYNGRTYRLGIGGLSAGLVFGAAKATFSGRVSNISRASDIEGVYGAAGAGAAAVKGTGAIVLTNGKGAVLEISGRQTGLMVNADLSGMAISLK